MANEGRVNEVDRVHELHEAGEDDEVHEIDGVSSTWWPWSPSFEFVAFVAFVHSLACMNVDTSGWSGDGDFTRTLLDVLGTYEDIAAIRVEDAPASRSGTGYNFLVNEVFVAFATATRNVASRWLGMVPRTRRVEERLLDLPALEARLATVEAVGAADYSDPGMLQFLRTQRIVAPYQTRGYKLVELVRVYDATRPPVA